MINLSQEDQVLQFITQHGPVSRHDINEFGVINYINNVDGIKNKLAKQGLIERFLVNKKTGHCEYMASHIYLKYKNVFMKNGKEK